MINVRKTKKLSRFVFGDQSVLFVSTKPKAFNNNLEIRSVGMPFLKPEYCFSFLSIYRDNSRKSFNQSEHVVSQLCQKTSYHKIFNFPT